MRCPFVIAHRGSSHHAPENTFAAFKLAISDAADGIELDVRLAADGVPVCIHDADLRRTAGRDLLVRDLTSAELSRIDVGSWFDARHTGQTFSGERVPTLAEALRMCRDAGRDFRIYVEMKCNESEAASLAHAVARVVAEAEDESRMIAASFTLSAIRFVKEAHAGIETAALFEPESESPAMPGGSYASRPPKIGGGSNKSSDIITRALDHGARGLMLHDELATSDMIDAARLRGLPVTVWTIGDADRARSLAAACAHAIITNDPARIRRSLATPAS